MFEWDENKRIRTLETRGLDFADATLIFDGRPCVTVAARHSDEVRFISTALLMENFHTVVWTWRGPDMRIISFRRARDEEARAYRAIYG